MTGTPDRVIRLRDVSVVERGSTILRDVDLDVAAREHSVLLGPNGAGKTTLLRVVSGYRFPTRGCVEVLGERFGRTDLRALRRRIGLASTALGDLLQVSAPVEVIVAAARYGATGPIPEVARDPDAREHAATVLARVGASQLVGRRCRTLSQGEWQRVQIARALVESPELLLLDEPMAGLDVGGRERLLADLERLMSEPAGPTVVLVTHHLEEVPRAIQRAVLMRDARVVASGPATDVLAPAPLSDTFGLDLDVLQVDGRFHARQR